MQMFERLSVAVSLCGLTSVLAVAKMRGHRDQPDLSQAHSSQGQIQPIDDFVCPQHHVLEVVIVVSGEIGPERHDDLDLSETSVCVSCVTHEEKSSVPSTSEQL